MFMAKDWWAVMCELRGNWKAMIIHGAKLKSLGELARGRSRSEKYPQPFLIAHVMVITRSWHLHACTTRAIIFDGPIDRSIELA
jgi:hypothetical protein